MGKKAKGDHTPGRPPLDDATQWLPLLEAVAERVKQTGDMRLALPDIEEEMACDTLPSMRRDLTTGEPEYLLPESGFWKANFVYYEEGGKPYADRPYVRVLPKDGRRWNIWASDPRDEDGGHAHFVSRSHFERLRPSSPQARRPDCASTESNSAPPVTSTTTPNRDGRQVARLKEMLSVVYPGGVPDNTTTQEVLARVGPEYKKFGWKDPSRSTIERALGRRT